MSLRRFSSSSKLLTVCSVCMIQRLPGRRGPARRHRLPARLRRPSASRRINYYDFVTNLLQLTPWAGAGRRGLENRQENRETAALPEFAFDLQGSAMAADDVLDDRKPQARAAQVARAR